MVMMSTLGDRLRKKRANIFRRSASDLDDRAVQDWRFVKFNGASGSPAPKQNCTSTAGASGPSGTTSTTQQRSRQRVTTTAVAAAEAHRRLLAQRSGCDQTAGVAGKLGPRASSTLGLSASAVSAYAASASPVLPLWMLPSCRQSIPHSPRLSVDSAAVGSDNGNGISADDSVTVLRRGGNRMRARPFSMCAVITDSVGRSGNTHCDDAGLSLNEFLLEDVLEAPEEAADSLECVLCKELCSDGASRSKLVHRGRNQKQNKQMSCNDLLQRAQKLTAKELAKLCPNHRRFAIMQQRPNNREQTGKNQLKRSGSMLRAVSGKNKESNKIKDKGAFEKKDSIDKPKEVNKAKGKKPLSIDNEGHKKSKQKVGSVTLNNGNSRSTAIVPDLVQCSPSSKGDGAGASGAREQRRVSDVALVTGSGDCRSHGGHGGEVDGSWESGHAGKLLKVESEDRAAMSSATTGSDRKSTIGRSESCRQERERFSRKKIIRERRKHSDPNIPAKDDEDEVTERLCTNTQSGSSSNSSLSTRFESPSTSMDSVLVCSASSGRQVATSGSSSAAAAAAAAAAAVFGEGCDGWDSDLEAEADPPRWEAFVPVVSARGSRKWTPADRKRLDVVNELFHTERTHVRNLKVLVRVFYRPLLDANILHSSDLHLLFGNVEELLKLHSQFNESMKERLRQRRLNESVGDILVSMFEGENGVNFRTAAAAFCRSQSLALSKLKTLRKRDSNLMTFLAGAESNPVCRRLQLKDILPTAMQRLTKYPLLLASLLKTVKADDERVLVQRAYDSSCQILAHVNKVKGDTERHERLVEIQSKLDQISFCRTDHPAVEQIGGRLDLTKYRLIHEGSVQFKFSSKSKHLELYMLLLEERFLVLLQRQQEDKYSLKFHTVNNNEMNPIIRTSSILVRENAAEKRAIIIINMVSTGPQYYELLFSTSNERDTWYQLIKNAADKDSVASGVSAKPIGRSHKRTESAHSILSAPSSDDNSQPQQQLQQHHLSSKGSPSPRPKSTAVFPAPPEENSTESGSEPGSSTSPGVVDTVNSETSSKAIDHHKPQQQQQQTQHQQQQKFEFIEASSLIDPSEVVVSCSVVHSAHSVVTPLERVRRADEQIRKALRQKQSVLDELITQQQPESTCSNNNIDSGCGDDDEEVPTQRLVLQAAVNVNSCVALIVGAMSKSQQSVSDTSTAETNSCSNSSSSNTSPSDSSCIQCVDVRESTVPTLEQLLQMQQQLADTLTQLLVSVERQQSERQQLRQLLERVHLLERQLSETASAQQSQQRQQTSMKEEEESSTMAVVDESAPQHNNSDSESLVEDKEQIDGAGVVECQQQQQANVEQIDGAGVVENQLQRQTNVKHIDGLDDHQQQQKAEVEQVDCSTAVECMEQQQQQQTGVLDVCSSPLPSQLETPAGEGSVLDDCTTGPTLLDTSGEEGVDDAVSLSKESCDTLCQQDQEHDESRDSSSSYDDASTLTTREKNELSAVDLQSSETTEPLVDTDPAPSSTTESPVSSSSQEISHTT